MKRDSVRIVLVAGSLMIVSALSFLETVGGEEASSRESPSRSLLLST